MWEMEENWSPAAAAGLEAPHGTPAPTAPQHKPEGRVGYPQSPCSPQNWKGFAHQSWAGRALRTRWQHRDHESLVEAVLLGRALLEQLGRAPCFPLTVSAQLHQTTESMVIQGPKSLLEMISYSYPA